MGKRNVSPSLNYRNPNGLRIFYLSLIFHSNMIFANAREQININPLVYTKATKFDLQFDNFNLFIGSPTSALSDLPRLHTLWPIAICRIMLNSQARVHGRNHQTMCTFSQFYFLMGHLVNIVVVLRFFVYSFCLSPSSKGTFFIVFLVL